MCLKKRRGIVHSPAFLLFFNFGLMLIFVLDPLRPLLHKPGHGRLQVERAFINGSARDNAFQAGFAPQGVEGLDIVKVINAAGDTTGMALALATISIMGRLMPLCMPSREISV